MSTIIKITETLYLVEVEKEYTRFLIDETDFYDGFYLFAATDKSHYVAVEKFDCDYKIIGPILTPELSFDFEVDDSWLERLCGVGSDFRDYKIQSNSKNKWNLTNKEESFRTRIQKAIKDEGLYLVNPLGGFDDFDKLVCNHTSEKLKQWQSYQGKLIKGNLILLEKIN